MSSRALEGLAAAFLSTAVMLAGCTSQRGMRGNDTPPTSTVSETAVKPCPPAEIERVRAVLPQGWTLAAKNNAITLRPPKPIKLVNRISAWRGAKDEDLVVPVEYAITLRFGPLVSRAERQRMAQENAAIGERMAAQSRQLAHLASKGDDWIPKTPKDRELVDEYMKLKASRHELPDLYGKDFSVWITDSTGPAISFLLLDDQEQCSEVQARIRRLFTEYGAEPGNAGASK